MCLRAHRHNRFGGSKAPVLATSRDYWTVTEMGAQASRQPPPPRPAARAAPTRSSSSSINHPQSQQLPAAGPSRLPSKTLDLMDDSRRAVAQILPNLWLGSREAASNLSLLKRLGIVACVNCTEHPHLFPKHFRYHHVCVADLPEVDITAAFEQSKCAQWVERQHADTTDPRGSGVLVYCQQGVSRSCAVTLALLLHLRPAWTLIGAYSHVKKQRRQVRPNLGFCKQLCAYELRVRGQQSAKVGRKGLEPVKGGTLPTPGLESCRRV